MVFASLKIGFHWWHHVSCTTSSSFNELAQKVTKIGFFIYILKIIATLFIETKNELQMYVYIAPEL